MFSQKTESLFLAFFFFLSSHQHVPVRVHLCRSVRSRAHTSELTQPPPVTLFQSRPTSLRVSGAAAPHFSVPVPCVSPFGPLSQNTTNQGLQHSFCAVLGAGRSTVRVQGAGEPPLPGCHTATLSLCPLMVESKAQLSGVSFIRAPIPSVSHSTLVTQSPPKGPASKNRHFGDWPQHRNLRGTHTFSPSYLLFFLSHLT